MAVKTVQSSFTPPKVLKPGEVIKDTGPLKESQAKFKEKAGIVEPTKNSASVYKTIEKATEKE